MTDERRVEGVECPSCGQVVKLVDGIIDGHDSWGRGSYALRCPASGRTPDEVPG